MKTEWAHSTGESHAASGCSIRKENMGVRNLTPHTQPRLSLSKFQPIGKGKLGPTPNRIPPVEGAGEGDNWKPNPIFFYQLFKFPSICSLSPTRFTINPVILPFFSLSIIHILKESSSNLVSSHYLAVYGMCVDYINNNYQS